MIIKVGGAIGIPQPPAGPNIPTELMPTVPPSRLNHSGFPSMKRQASARTGRGRLRNASAARYRRCDGCMR